MTRCTHTPPCVDPVQHEAKKRRPTSAERKLAKAEAKNEELRRFITTLLECKEFRACVHCLRAASKVAPSS